MSDSQLEPDYSAEIFVLESLPSGDLRDAGD
jgi:hypothetical protein